MQKIILPSSHWDRFLDSIDYDYGSPASWWLAARLKKEHGTIMWNRDGRYSLTGISFETEEDLLAFKLKY